MRKILFKAKTVKHRKWVEGSLVVLDEEHMYIVPRHENASTLPVSAIIGYSAICVDPETVCQYTGLTDKNGKRIFEGDIVIYDNSPYNAYCEPQKGVISWRNGSLSFKYRPWTSVMYRPLCSDDFFSGKCEVIGNINDNPDLLEVRNG